MLVLSLIGSLILFFFANWAIHGQGGRRLAFFLCGVGLTVAPILLGIFLPPVALLFLFLSLAMVRVGDACLRRRWLFPVAAVAAFAIPGCFALQEQLELARLREQFPYQSLEERLPPPRAAFRHGKRTNETAQRLDELEDYLTETSDYYENHPLKLLHEDTVGLFISHPGFGVARLSHPSLRGLTSHLRPEVVVPQPEQRTISPWSPDEVAWQSQAAGDGLHQLHQGSIEDFVNVPGFGFVRDREHVAGFQPHQFSGLPGPAERWEVRHLDLVGLLLHEGPVAYVSDNLPRMDELRQAPTRPLDSFEVAALERQRGGEDLVVGRTPDGLRMLGGIRSMKQCLECHGGERGDLLGAFSYALRRSKE